MTDLDRIMTEMREGVITIDEATRLIRGESMTHPHGIVGAWYYDAVGAPFPPHVIIFHADGTLISSNPDRGETNNSASAGIGVWQRDHPRVVGRFVEVNADPTTHIHTSNLVVDFTVTIDNDTFVGAPPLTRIYLGDLTFTGPATATVYNPDGTLADGPFPATLKGQRITLTSPPPVAA